MYDVSEVAHFLLNTQREGAGFDIVCCVRVGRQGFCSACGAEPMRVRAASLSARNASLWGRGKEVERATAKQTRPVAIAFCS